MAQIGHTPGPWVTQRSPHLSDGQYDFAVHATKAKVIAEAFGRDTNGNIINAEANAHLISAAPELLAALEDLRAFVGVMIGRGADAVVPETVDTPLGISVKIGSIMRDAEAAVAKAEGRS